MRLQYFSIENQVLNNIVNIYLKSGRKRTVGHTGIACGVRHKSKVLVENNVVDYETRILFLKEEGKPKTQNKTTSKKSERVASATPFFIYSGTCNFPRIGDHNIYNSPGIWGTKRLHNKYVRAHTVHFGSSTCSRDDIDHFLLLPTLGHTEGLVHGEPRNIRDRSLRSQFP